ncbi:SDR family NAD(P)-dependent oxidoreductase [Thalassorhabdus alkalitolerans]|uniref:SDR family NAD(P)-dependent oxidoreductase n=1 Tax=Thalassorhabdus alkalitolerans TaxID=2282697 RepID=A0ABW0YU91_9BACI
MSIFREDSLAGEHALITGATGGIGKETARLLASMGADITITGRNKEKLAALKVELTNSSPDISVASFPCDIGNNEEREELVHKAKKENGKVTILINSAGVLGGNVLEELTQEVMEKVMHINYTSAVLLSQLVYPDMKERQKGAVINVSSLSGLRGTYGNTAYAASKFALIGFTHSFAVEAIQHGIRVNAVCPGYVDTEMGSQAIEKAGKRQHRTLPEQLQIVNASLPSGRITSPEEVAHTIAFLATDSAKNIVGEAVKISGGGVL